MKNMQIHNRLETRDAILSFIKYTGKEKIYLYGFNAYLKYFALTIPLPVTGILSDTEQETWKEIPSILVSTLLHEEEIKDIRIISFLPDFDKARLFFIGLGFSAVSQIFDGLHFLESDYGIPTYHNRLVFTGLSRFDDRESGIYTYDVGKRQTKCRLHGSYRDIKNDGENYIALEENGGITFLNGNFEKEREIAIEGMDLHGLSFCESEPDYLFVVETACDRIGIYHRHTGVKEATFLFSALEMDNRHMNDILVTNDSIFLSLFSLGASFEIYRQNDKVMLDGAVVRLDKKSGMLQEIIADGLMGPHTIFCLNNDIYFCDSLKGDLYCNREIIIHETGFLRGIYSDGLRFFVGQSTTRRAPLLRADAMTTFVQTGIYCFDPSHKTILFHEIPRLDVYSIIPRGPLPGCAQM